MFNKVVVKLGEAISRRSILGKVASAVTVTLFGIFGLEAKTCNPPLYPRACCCLCSSSGCTGKTCSATWCWMCPYRVGVNCIIYKCTECYSSTSGCSNTDCDGSSTTGCPNCDYIVCSTYIDTGMPCTV